MSAPISPSRIIDGLSCDDFGVCAGANEPMTRSTWVADEGSEHSAVGKSGVWSCLSGDDRYGVRPQRQSGRVAAQNAAVRTGRQPGAADQLRPAHGFLRPSRPAGAGRAGKAAGPLCAALGHEPLCGDGAGEGQEGRDSRSGQGQARHVPAGGVAALHRHCAGMPRSRRSRRRRA